MRENRATHYNIFKTRLLLNDGRLITIQYKNDNTDSAITEAEVSEYKPYITDVVIGDKVTTLGSSVFSGCTKLENIDLPSGVTTISAYTFNGCSSLTNIEFNDKITYMARYAVFNCKSLTNVTIPDSITHIEVGCFRGCSKLSNVTVLATTPPTLGTQVFDGNASDRKFYVPSESVEAYEAATSWSVYANYILPIPT